MNKNIRKQFNYYPSSNKKYCAGENEDESNATLRYNIIFITVPSIGNTASNGFKNNCSSTACLKYANEKRLR